MALTFERIEDPGTILPWWLVSQVLGMPAGQFGHPVAVSVLMETQQACAPSVRRAVAFGRYGG